MTDRTETSPTPLGQLAWIAVVLLLLALPFAIHRELLGFGTLGIDSPLLVHSSTVDPSRGWFGLLTQVYLDGWLETEFYRPGIHLMTAVELVVLRSGESALQVGNLAGHGFASVGLFLLARALLGGRALLAPLIPSLLFALHPLLSTSLPVLARRHDAVCFGLVALVLAFALRVAGKPGAPRPVDSAGLFAGALAAISIKETAFLLPPLATLLLVLQLRGEGRRRLGRIVAPLWLALALLLGLRFALLGGMGGPAGASPRELVALLWPCARRLVVPGFWVPDGPIVAAVAVAMIAGVALCAVRAPARLRPALLLAAAWGLAIVLLNAYSAYNRPWQALPALGALGIVQAVALERFRATRGAAEGLAAVLVIAPGLWALAWSPAVRGHEQWSEANARAEAFKSELLELVSDAAPGDFLEGPARPLDPLQAAPKPVPGQVESLSILAPKSVEAWLQTQRPGLWFRVLGPRAAAEPDPARVTVRLGTASKRRNS